MRKEDELKVQEIKLCIEGAKKILLHCHPFSDPDSVGSVLAMREFLLNQGKEVVAIIGDSTYPAALKSLNLKEKILDLNYFEIDSKEFDLFIILDSSSKAQISRIAEIDFPKGMKTIAIDHHKTNEGFADINLIREDCASTTHVLFKLFNFWDVKISKDVALYLFLGLFADTGGFKYLNSTPDVLFTAASLATINPDYHRVVFDIENSKTPLEIEMMSLALSSINKYFNGKVVFSSIPYEVIKEKNLSREQALEGLVPNILRSVVEWEIVASLVEVEKEETIVSLRTRNERVYDVSKIAISTGVDGGGHPGAAGTTVKKDIAGAQEELINSIKKLFGTELEIML
ncbi:MAG: DHH family phosphoesterase [Candidatus Dojkabacteria bacterium]|jgi:phosphoesterase RecJ-like protein